MRLELGRRADYAIRAVVDLARHASATRRRTARTIADAMDVPVGYLPQILAELVRAGLVSSVSGRDGGYFLARDPSDIDLLAVVQSVDGELGSTVCVLRGGPCRWDEVCAVHVPWMRAQQAMLETLAATSLAEVVAIDAALDAGTYLVPEGLEPWTGAAARVGAGTPGPDPATTTSPAG